MKNFLNQLNAAFARLMQGRYGPDRFSRFLSVTACVFFVLSWFSSKRTLYYIGLMLLIYCWFRMLSRNFAARRRELESYLAYSARARKSVDTLKRRFTERGTHAFYTCPGCRATVRIPKQAKGKTIRITCPKCGTQFEKRT